MVQGGLKRSNTLKRAKVGNADHLPTPQSSRQRRLRNAAAAASA